jgi:hypothetical protein
MRFLPSPACRCALLFLLVSTGCNSAYHQAMTRAREAALRGDALAAARSYRDACAAAPQEAKACAPAGHFAQRAIDEALTAARPVCEAGELDACLPPLLAAKDLRPEHPEVNTLLEQAGQLHAERCAGWPEEGPLSEALAGFACLQSRESQLPVPRYQHRLLESARHVSARFLELATTAHRQGESGAAFVLGSATQCLFPGESLGTQVGMAQERFLSESALPIVPTLGGSIPPPIAEQLSEVCRRLPSPLAPATRCEAPEAGPGRIEPLPLQVDALIQSPVERVSEDTERVSYVKDRRWVHNPDHASAQAALDSASDTLKALVREKADKDSACAAASKSHEAGCVGCPAPPEKPECEEAEALAASHASQSRKVDAARTHLNHTPAQVEELLYEDHSYPVWTYTWTSDFRFTLQSSTSAAPLLYSGGVRFSDETHEDFSPANLQADPLVRPSASDYAQAFLEQLTPHVVQLVKQGRVARGAERRAACATLPPDWSSAWVQCWAEASLWEQGQPPQGADFLQLLLASADPSARLQCR